VSKAKELGHTKIALPTAGNAGSAAAAYAAKAGMECHVFMPEDTPPAFRIECERYGAKVVLVAGLIDDCGRIVAENAPREGWHVCSTLKEPFRVEGKKTMGYELAEDFGWTLPDAILFPTGGGTGLIGAWKAFAEMEEMGWIGEKRPKMFAVQAEGCAPIPKAFREGKAISERWQGAHTYASGLRVPNPFADYLILRFLRESGGGAVAVTDDQIRRACDEIGEAEGLFVAPEGGAAWAAAKDLLAAGRLDPKARIVLFNTGSGFKYL
ncbi:MAG TPA: threonine synthase, partial [Thermoanaerobaculia bacterium]|nr:threonine synthase [Thermoanaerobaculia bacterium]